jgi:hypothetical protein
MTENDLKALRLLTAMANGANATLRVATNHTAYGVIFEDGVFYLPVTRLEFDPSTSPPTQVKDYLPLDWSVRELWYYCSNMTEEELQEIEATVPIGT